MKSPPSENKDYSEISLVNEKRNSSYDPGNDEEYFNNTSLSSDEWKTVDPTSNENVKEASSQADDQEFALVLHEAQSWDFTNEEEESENACEGAGKRSS